MGTTHKIIPNDILLRDISKLLEEGKTVTLLAKGYSMLPFIQGGKDSLILKKFEKYHVGDIVLAEVSKDFYIMHRVISLENGVTLMGDGNIRGKEHCQLKDIKGKVISIVHKGKNINPDTRLQKSLSKIWNILLPCRRILLGIYRRRL
jgi:hypothetical protein